MDGWSRSALAMDLLFFFSGMEWISRLRRSESASTIPNIVVVKPSEVVTKPNIAIVGRCVRGRA